MIKSDANNQGNDFINDGHQRVISERNPPEVNNLLIIGSSSTSISFSENIQNIGRFNNINHVRNAQDALTALLREEYAVVIIDNDSEDMNTVTLSRIVKVNQPLSRVIVISQYTTKKLLVTLINLGSIDSYMQIPIEDFTAHSLVLEQQARYEINRTLNQFILHPPKFSPAYYLISDPDIAKQQNDEFDLVGCVVSFETVTRYVYFRRDYLTTDEVLLSGYMSAITMLGQTLFSKSTIDSIDFGGVAAIFKTRGKLHYAFFLENLLKNDYHKAERFLDTLASELTMQYGNILETGMVEPSDSRIINSLIESKIQEISEVKRSSRMNRKGRILSFGPQYLNVSIQLSQMEDRFDIVTIVDEQKAYDYLAENEVDVVLVQPMLTKINSNLFFTGRVLDIQPKAQIIGVNNRFHTDQLIKILNSGVVSTVIEAHLGYEELLGWINRAVEHSRSIDISSTEGIKQRPLLSKEGIAISKSVLRNDETSFLRIRHPELYGIFIARDTMPYYSKFFTPADITAGFDEVLLSGFISSLESFAKEMFASSQPYSGVGLGNASLIIFNQFDFSFAFFTGNVDESNYLVVNQYISKCVHNLFDLISNAEASSDLDLENFDKDVPKKIDQILIELFMSFASLSF